MRILKVRLAKNDRISIEYDAENKHKGRDEFSMTCMDRAIPQFYKALEALSIHVLQICQLPDSYAERLTLS